MIIFFVCSILRSMTARMSPKNWVTADSYIQSTEKTASRERQKFLEDYERTYPWCVSQPAESVVSLRLGSACDVSLRESPITHSSMVSRLLSHYIFPQIQMAIRSRHGTYPLKRKRSFGGIKTSVDLHCDIS